MTNQVNDEYNPLDLLRDFGRAVKSVLNYIFTGTMVVILVLVIIPLFASQMNPRYISSYSCDGVEDLTLKEQVMFCTSRTASSYESCVQQAKEAVCKATLVENPNYNPLWDEHLRKLYTNKNL
jgi:hypothetical protein